MYFWGTYIGFGTCYMQHFASRNRFSIVPSSENIPNTHFFELNGATNTRIVLGDWYTQGSVLQVDSDNFNLKTRPFDTELK